MAFITPQIALVKREKEVESFSLKNISLQNIINSEMESDELMILYAADYRNESFDIPPDKFVLVMPGALIDFDKIGGVTSNLSDLNFKNKLFTIEGFETNINEQIFDSWIANSSGQLKEAKLNIKNPISSSVITVLIQVFEDGDQTGDPDNEKSVNLAPGDNDLSVGFDENEISFNNNDLIQFKFLQDITQPVKLSYTIFGEIQYRI